MDDLDNMLDGLGLSQYAAAFRNEGFDTWSTITDITENDLYVVVLRLTFINASDADTFAAMLLELSSAIEGYASSALPQYSSQ